MSEPARPGARPARRDTAADPASQGARPDAARMVLGIETSCDDTSVAVLGEGTRLLAHRIAAQDVHRLYGGVVPELASRRHLEVLQESHDIVGEYLEKRLALLGRRVPGVADMARSGALLGDPAPAGRLGEPPGGALPGW